MPPFFKLAGRVASNTDVGPEDTRNVKTALSRLGYFKVPEWGITEWPTPDMFDGLKKFQKDHDLKPDGVMNADGPTLRKLNQEFGKHTKSPIHDAPAGTTVPARVSGKVGLGTSSRFDTVTPSPRGVGDMCRAQAAPPDPPTPPESPDTPITSRPAPPDAPDGGREVRPPIPQYRNNPRTRDREVYIDGWASLEKISQKPPPTMTNVELRAVTEAVRRGWIDEPAGLPEEESLRWRGRGRPD